jgi:hypothetical protein
MVGSLVHWFISSLVTCRGIRVHLVLSFCLTSKESHGPALSSKESPGQRRGLKSVHQKTYTFTHIYTSPIHTHPHICTSAHPHICTSAHPHIRTSAHPHIRTSTHPHIHTSTHPHIHTSTHPHIHTSAHLHICTSTHLHICTSAHPHIRISSYSALKLFTGLISAAFIACKLTVNRAMTMIIPPESAKTHHCTGV